MRTSFQIVRFLSIFKLFEHLLSVYLKQLDHFKDLLSVQPSISKSYFAAIFDDDEIKDVSALYTGIDDVSFHEMIEDRDQFLDRRNGFLDHLLSRQQAVMTTTSIRTPRCFPKTVSGTSIAPATSDDTFQLSASENHHILHQRRTT